MESIGTLWEPIIGEGIEVKFTPELDLGTIQADESQLGQVLLNLAVNARDAMAEGGLLHIQTENRRLDPAHVEEGAEVQAGSYVLLTITDSGEGMDRETQERIFDSFFITREVGKGTGLGLSTVHGIVERHGGHIQLESELGEGSTFRIYWPRVDRESPEAIEKDLAPGLGSHLGGGG